MKKLLALILCVCLMLCTFSCARDNSIDYGTLKIVTTSASAYDWTKNVIADAFDEYDLTIIGGGADPHSFSPSATDIMKIASADIFIFVGGESENWAREVELKDGAIAISLIDSLDSSRLISDHGVVDEHVWLSPYNAQILCKEIEKAIITLRPDYQSALSETLENYALKLLELEREYLAITDGFSAPTIIVADRFPFAYLAKDCSLGYYSVFPTCSTDSEATFDKITNFAKIIDKTGAKRVIVTENSDKSLANTIIENTQSKDCEIVRLDSLQASATGGYIEMLKGNISVLKSAIFEDAK